MKKIVKMFIFAIALFFVNTNFAHANDLYNLDITADIKEDGNAHITEVWDMYLDDGTELYKPMGNLDNMEISNFTVKDESGKIYSFINWDVNASLSEKAYKNGFNREDGVFELCWGMSSHGKHTYTISYDISNFVRVYDYDVIYYKFVNDSMNPAPESFSITINYQGTPIEMYTFGFEGEYEGKKNIATVKSSGSLSEYNYAVVLMKFDKGTFNTNNIITGQTYDDIYEMAFKNAETAKKQRLYDILLIIFSMLVPFSISGACIGVGLIAADKETYEFESGYTKKKLKDIYYFRDIPTNDIFEAYYISKAYQVISETKSESILGAVILKWIKDGQIKVIEGKGKKATFDLSKEYEGNSNLESTLYSMMKSASKNNVLKSEDFSKYCSKHYTEYQKWFKSIKEEYDKKYLTNGKIKMIPKKKSFYKYEKKQFISSVDELAIRIAGVKKFLNDFSRIDTRGSIEVHMWEYYLIYAQIFGIADKVAEEFKKLYPDIVEQSNLSYSDCLIIHSVNNSISQHVATTSGSSSVGGGGGSFGGGSGGGAR